MGGGKKDYQREKLPKLESLPLACAHTSEERCMPPRILNQLPLSTLAHSKHREELFPSLRIVTITIRLISMAVCSPVHNMCQARCWWGILIEYTNNTTIKWPCELIFHSNAVVQGSLAIVNTYLNTLLITVWEMFLKKREKYLGKIRKW